MYIVCCCCNHTIGLIHNSATTLYLAVCYRESLVTGRKWNLHGSQLTSIYDLLQDAYHGLYGQIVRWFQNHAYLDRKACGLVKPSKAKLCPHHLVMNLQMMKPFNYTLEGLRSARGRFQMKTKSSFAVIYIQVST